MENTMQVNQDEAKRKPAADRSLVTVYDGRDCVGHLIRRGAAGVEGFDINDQSVGLFENDDAAAAAVWRAARGSGA
jgi:hypothetical protein